MAELVGGVGYGLAAEGDVGEGVEAVEEEVGVGGGGRRSCVSVREGELTGK